MTTDTSARPKPVVRTVSPDEDLSEAIVAVRERPAGAHAIIRLLPGTHRLDAPLTLTQRDSNLTIESAQQSDRAVIDGSRPITEWTPATIKGRRAVTAPLEAVGRSLYLRDRRMPRPRFPRDGTLPIEGVPGYQLGDPANTLFSGSASFSSAPGDLDALGPLSDVQSLRGVDALVKHYWVLERMPIVGFDRDTRVLTSSHRSIFALRADVSESFADYWLENTAATFGERPGEWYFEPATGLLSYILDDDDDLTDLLASVPVTHSLLEVVGDPADRASNIRVTGIDFAHTDYRMPSHAGKRFGIREDSVLSETDFASAPQAAADVEGAISLRWVDDVRFDDITVRAVGGYAIELQEGCSRVQIQSSTFEHLGAGAVIINGDQVEDTLIENSTIRYGGEVFPQAAGILVRFASRTRIVSCDISHLEYSGISIGWTWDYGDPTTPGTYIARNHIHHLGGSRLMSDLGGIYTLGEQPGTILERNWIHDIECASYGGWGIYLDEATSGVSVRENVIHDVSSEAVHLHYGRGNLVTDNLLVGGAHAVVALTRADDQVAMMVSDNVLVALGTPVYRVPPSLPANSIASSSNRIAGSPTPAVAAASGHYTALGIWVWDAETDFTTWNRDHDTDSAVVDDVDYDPERIRRADWLTAIQSSRPVADFIV